MKKIIKLLIIVLCPLQLLGQSIEELEKFVASDRGNHSQFGSAISISGDYMVVGASGEDNDGSGMAGQGAVYIFERDEDAIVGEWNQVQRLVSSDREAHDLFGHFVSISGDYLVVGAVVEDHDASGANELSAAGSVYVFERDGSGTWNEVQKLVASDREADDQFGVVSISGDYIVVGATLEGHDTSGANELIGAGSVYVFERDGSGTWNEVQKLVASDRGANDRFGIPFISGDYIVVGAAGEDHDASGANELIDAGSVYVFERDGSGTWNEVQKLVASDRGAGDRFGQFPSISGDYMAVPAFLEDHDAIGANELSDAGSVYIFERDGSGTWNEVQKLVSGDREANDQFGRVSISGNYLVVGAFLEDHDAIGANELSDAGSAYVFKRDGSGTWNEVQKLVAGDRGANDSFGNSVSISGSDIIVGAHLEEHDVTGANEIDGAGSIYTFFRYDIAYSAGTWNGGSGVSGAPNASDAGKSVIVRDGSATIASGTSLSLSDLQIYDGASLTLEPTASLSLSNSGVVLGAESLVLSSDVSGTASLVDVGIVYGNLGSIKVERYLEASSVVLPYEGGYHFIGSPIANHSKFNDMNELYGYRESDLTWLHHTDGVDGFSTFTNGKGYAIRYTSNITKSFIGQINTGDYMVPVTSTDHSGDVYEDFNLLSNPYPSSISGASFVSFNSGFVSGNLYFWNGSDYSVYNTVMGAGTAGSLGVVPDGNIAVGQAFFVEAHTAGTITFNNAMRGVDSDIFYRKGSYPELRLLVRSGDASNDLLLTGYPESSNGLDSYDAKHLPGSKKLSISSLIDGSGYDIQSVPNLSSHVFDLEVDSFDQEDLEFSLTELSGLAGHRIYLEDLASSSFVDISTSSYSAKHLSDYIGVRFKLHVLPTLEERPSLWVDQGFVNVYNNGEILEGELTLISLDGKILSVTKSNYLPCWNDLPVGVYLLTFKGDTHHFVEKLIKY